MTVTPYKPDVDGLRAIAVLAVIIFHFNSHWLPGGFVGVDIFFVISGYIITRMLLVEMEHKEFSFFNFYIKRIKRILPLFYLVSITTLIVGWLILTPADLVALADSIRYASVFIANIYFEKNTGYFAPAASSLPLLHLWSLSVEEQFYFIWPLLLFCSVTYLSSKKSVLLFLPILFLLVGISEYFARTDASAAYYLIYNRGGELLIGALLSLFIHNKSGLRQVNEKAMLLAGMLGASTLILSLFFITETAIFPGIKAAMIALATAAVIYHGELRKGRLYLGLSNPYLVKLGKLSFSLYLWHWPILVLYKYYFNDINALGYIFCFALTFVCAYLSWQYFEKPLRYWQTEKKWVLVIYLILPILALVGLAKNIKNNAGYENRLPENAREIYKVATSTYDSGANLKLTSLDYGPFELLKIGAQDDSLVTPRALIWGDSHARHFRPFVDKMGKENNFYALYGGAGGCPPLMAVDLIKHGRPEAPCTSINNALFEQIKDSDASVVFLAGRWAMYTQTRRAEGEKGSRVYLGDSSDYSESVENSRRAFKKGLENTIRLLIANNKKPVIFEQAPAYPFLPSNCLIKKHTYAWRSADNCNIDRDSVELRQHYANKVIYELASIYPELTVIAITELMCDENECISALKSVPFYSDNDHLNKVGSELLFTIYQKTQQYKELRHVLK